MGTTEAYAQCYVEEAERAKPCRSRESGVVVGVSGWSWLGVGVVHPGFFLGVVLLAAEVQARPQPRESDLLELAGHVSDGLGDGRQGGSFSDHGFILDLGRVAGRGARDQHDAAEIPARRVVALELVLLDEDVLLENQRRRTHGGPYYTKRLAGTQRAGPVGAMIGVLKGMTGRENMFMKMR